MKAKILQLKDKYYGTEILIITNNEEEVKINIWNTVGKNPSKRQLKKDGYKSTKQWIQDGGLENCNYESEWTYNFCRQLVKIINNGYIKE